MQDENRTLSTSGQASRPERPETDDPTAWRAYWYASGQPWRRECEIDVERQHFLAARLLTEPDIKQGIYPFTGIQLSRADVEWMLANHESGGMRGPVDWSDVKQRERDGLDLRGADLRSVDLSGLPLARIRAGLTYNVWASTTVKQTEAATAKMEGVRLDHAHIEGALLVAVSFHRASLEASHLEYADLQLASFERTWLALVHLERANLRLARFPSAWLEGARLEGANLRDASFDKASNLEAIVLGSLTYGFAYLTDVHWDGVNLGAIDWTQLPMLGEEQEAKRWRLGATRKRKSRGQRLEQYAVALRGTRQLAIELRNQGLGEEADYFALRAHNLQRHHFRRQRRWLHYLGSFVLAAMAGYGYRPLRSFATYVLVIVGFATAYYFIAPSVGLQMDPIAAGVFSVTSFHGRGFSPSPGENVALTNPLTILAGAEAIVGLLIEITFISTFTHRFFSR